MYGFIKNKAMLVSNHIISNVIINTTVIYAYLHNSSTAYNLFPL